MPQTHTSFTTEEITGGIDVLEELIQPIDKALINILLMDRTTRRNILWATADYETLGSGYEEFSEIRPEHITGTHATLIQPRITKALNAQNGRTKDKAEVFTPSWICNKQNNLVDAQWFGRKDVFNVEEGITWTVTEGNISFNGVKKNWKKYVDAQRLEISCGEAPYLVSRYNTVTGEKIPLDQRIGLLDRKMRIVNENTFHAEEWLTWSQRAFESIYGYEYQGDNLLLARMNLLYSYIEYYYAKFSNMPSNEILSKIARIISWNIWQMDGLKYVVPGSCKLKDFYQITLFDMDLVEGHPVCPGCAKGDIFRHTGIYCKIQDWRFKTSRTFISMMKGGNSYAKL